MKNAANTVIKISPFMFCFLKKCPAPGRAVKLILTVKNFIANEFDKNA